MKSPQSCGPWPLDPALPTAPSNPRFEVSADQNAAYRWKSPPQQNRKRNSLNSRSLASPLSCQWPTARPNRSRFLVNSRNRPKTISPALRKCWKISLFLQECPLGEIIETRPAKPPLIACAVPCWGAAFPAGPGAAPAVASPWNALRGHPGTHWALLN